MKDRDLELIDPAVDFVRRHPGITDEFYPIVMDMLKLGYRLGKYDKQRARISEIRKYLKYKIEEGH